VIRVACARREAKFDQRPARNPFRGPELLRGNSVARSSATEGGDERRRDLEISGQDDGR
jgi:hypothetical protein